VAEPKTLRNRLLAVAGRVVRSGRRTHLRLDKRWPWASTVAAAVATLRAIPDPI
jgi:Transposase DDE domain group 1